MKASQAARYSRSSFRARFSLVAAPVVTSLLLCASAPLLQAQGNPHNPAASLTLGSDGNFYGTTTNGGANNLGTVYRVTSAGALSIVHSFSGITDGAHPLDRVIFGWDGRLYGTTSAGGANGTGTVFELGLDGSFLNLWSFEALGVNNTNFYGASPHSPLTLDSVGNLYGTTYQGGAYGTGTIFYMSFTATSHWIYRVHSFSVTGNYGTDIDGGYPVGGLVRGNDGYFYGTTVAGGAFPNSYVYGYGTVYQMNPSTWTVQTLHVFSEANGEGGNPNGDLLFGFDGWLYGTTYVGGAGSATGHGAGTLFKCSTSGTFYTQVSFTGPNGANPASGSLTLDQYGSLYGTTKNGGGNNLGTVFYIPSSSTSTVLNTLHSFSAAEGSHPSSTNLVFGADGFLYGTTYDGGPTGFGAVFRMSPGGGLSDIHAF
jgi:uncharacterized repeat protein (TIGR03803 family)